MYDSLSKIVELIEAENGMVVTKGWRMGLEFLNVYKVVFVKIWKSTGQHRIHT